ncbi:hypothetical protein [Celeribacter sp. PS-C1]|uniref:hypothetical protein n=1 Tax=Celeribacter sp. PS-C1 TaxID=2820813 RepID=UPI001CA49ECD|nr:hypothetical protein [Celeribacter sp. PS-C1]
MRQIYLHIGHLKTGSSALQVAFARSKDALREHGYIYPDHRSTELALSGKFTAGNVLPHRLIENLETALDEARPDEKVLFSSEGLFDDLDAEDCQIANLVGRGAEISVLLFLRHPIEFAISTYQQTVQGAGYEGTLEEFLPVFDKFHQVERVLTRLEALGIGVTIKSFDRTKMVLIDEVELWLGLPKNTLQRLGDAPVNRSLSRAEQAFLRRLSGHLGVSGSDHIGASLVNGLPVMPREKAVLSRESYDEFVARITPVVARLNARLPASLQYEITAFDALCEEHPKEEVYSFTGEQLDIITKALATRTPGPELVRKFVMWLKSNPEETQLQAEQIYMLNRIGHALRPGQFPEKRMKRLLNKAKRPKV